MIKWWRIKYNTRSYFRKIGNNVKGIYKDFKRWRHVRQCTKLVKKEGNGYFYTHQLIENAHWYDIYFVSDWDGKPTCWNVTIETTKMAYHNKIQSIASREAYEAWPNQLPFEESWTFVPVEEGSKYSTMVDKEKDLTNLRREYSRLREVELYESGQVRVAPWSYNIEQDYAYGTGLHVRLNVPFINEEVINDFIRVFSEKGRAVFNDKYNKPIALSMEEVGVEIDKESGNLYWNDGTLGQSVALDIDLSDRAE